MGNDGSRVMAGLRRAGTEGTAGDGKAMRGRALGGGHVIWRLWGLWGWGFRVWN